MVSESFQVRNTAGDEESAALRFRAEIRLGEGVFLHDFAKL